MALAYFSFSLTADVEEYNELSATVMLVWPFMNIYI